ncbi:MAG: hypothetical protein WA771_01555 [Chthoniobacterales bacterium]
MKIARQILTLAGLFTVLIGTPACEMQRADVIVKGYGDKHDDDHHDDAHAAPVREAPPTYFKE